MPCAANMPGHDVGDRDAEPERRSIGRAGDAHQAAFGLHDGVVSRLLRIAARCGRNRRSSSRRGADAWLRARRSRARAGSSVPGRKFSTSTSAFAISRSRIARPSGCLKSSVDALLVPVDAQEVRALAFEERRAPRARVVALAGLFDLDDARAHVGEQHRAIGPDRHACQVENGDSVEWRHNEGMIIVYAGSA